jgi:hypothetical protein
MGLSPFVAASRADCPIGPPLKPQERGCHRHKHNIECMQDSLLQQQVSEPPRLKRPCANRFVQAITLLAVSNGPIRSKNQSRRDPVGNKDREIAAAYRAAVNLATARRPPTAPSRRLRRPRY